MFQALKNHVVFRVATVYVIAGWLLIQFADISLEAFNAPSWVMQLFLFTVLGGLPVALIISWLVNRATLGGVANTVITSFSVVFALLVSVLAYQNWAPGATPDETMLTDKKSVASSKTIASRDSQPVIAVLPLSNMSADRSNEYLADGMTEDIITLLAQSPGIEVIARNSTFKYKNTNPDIRDVGRDLNADYVVEGSIRPIGDRLRVTLQVIDASTGSHVLAEKYDRPMSDFFEIQDDVTLAIAAAVGDAVFRSDFRNINQSRTESLTAWGLTSQVDVKMNAPGFGEADIANVRRAIELDPGYALAKAVLAKSLAFHTIYFTDEPLAGNPKLIEAVSIARQAFNSSPSDPKVVTYLAATLMWSGQPEEALLVVEKVPSMSPSYAEGIAYYGDILIHNGSPLDGFAQLARALELTPDAPQRTIYKIMQAEAHIQSGEWGKAELLLEESLRDFGSNNYGNRYLAGVKLQLGKRDEAASYLAPAIGSATPRSLEREENSIRFVTVDAAEKNFLKMFKDLRALEKEILSANSL